MVVLPPNFLDSGASIVCPSSPCIHHHGINSLTSCESPHVHQTQEVGTLVPIFFWVHGGQSYLEPKYFYLQNLKNLFYHSKILQDGLCGRNVYICTLQHAYENECDHDVETVHMYTVSDVHEHVELVYFETRFPILNG